MARKTRALLLSGVRFGQLVAVDRVGHRNKKILWKCYCDCGRETLASSNDLRTGNTKSCGCSKYDTKTIDLKDGYNSTPLSCANVLFKDYKHGADERNYNFSLSFEEFVDLTSRNCHYCGSSPSKISRKSKNGQPYVYNGIDRKDNSVGYIFENCLPCCSFCNVAKHKKSYEEFTSWLKRAGKYQLTNGI
jgi:hypothetical protein